jgi:ligand-binding sensor domain-containing protein
MSNGDEGAQAPVPKASPEEIVCEACGAANTDADEVCRSCGEPLWEDEAEDEGGAPEGWKPLVIGGILAAIVLGLFLWKPWNKKPVGATGLTSTATGPTNEIHELQQDGDLIWVGTSGGVFAHDRKTLEVKTSKTDGLLHPFIDSLSVDHNGKKWFGSFGGGVNVFDGTNWTQYPPNLTHGNTSVFSFVDKANTVWFATDGAGLISFDGKDWHQYTTNEGLPHNKVHVVNQDKDGALWVGTEDGLAVQQKDGKWKIYRTADGLAHNHVLVILFDQKGEKWIGTWGGGLSHWDGTTWKTIKSAPAPAGPNSDYILSGKMDTKGRLWFGTYDGVAMFDGSQWTQYHEADGLGGTDIWATEIDSDGYKWFGSYKGISRLSPDDKEWKRIIH